MNRNTKYLMAAGAAALLISGQAMACDGTACAAGQANQTAMQQEGGNCPNQAAAPGWRKKHLAMIPGKSSGYVRRILNRGDEIDLSTAQRSQIEEILVAAEKNTAESRAKSDALAAELHGKLRTGGISDSEIDTYAKRMGELHAARLQANLAASVRASSLLSAEQKKKFHAGMKKTEAVK